MGKKEKKTKEVEQNQQEEMQVVDVETDERKKLQQLMREGKISMDPGHRKFILCTDKPFNGPERNNGGVSPIYKVYIEDIESVSIDTTYDDLISVNPKVMKVCCTLKHKGYRTFDRITIKQLKELLKDGIITKDNTKYVHVDFSRKIRLLSDKPKPPPIDVVTAKYEELVNDYTKLHKSKPDVSYLSELERKWLLSEKNKQEEVHELEDDTEDIGVKTVPTEEVENEEEDFEEEELEEEE